MTQNFSNIRADVVHEHHRQCFYYYYLKPTDKFTGNTVGGKSTGVELTIQCFCFPSVIGGYNHMSAAHTVNDPPFIFSEMLQCNAIMLTASQASLDIYKS